MINSSFWKNKNVLITGHTGFKGSWLSTILIHCGAKVTGISNRIEKHHLLFSELELEKNINHHLIDIRNRTALEDILNKTQPEIIFHLAAQAFVPESYANPLTTFETNIMGTIHLLHYLPSSVKVFMNITTDKVYENNDQENRDFIESDQLGGDDPYSTSKVCSELITNSYRHSFYQDKNILIVTARAGNVIGGGDYSPGRLIPDIFRSIEQKEPLILRNPDSTRPWQHVLDCCSGYLTWGQKLHEEKSDIFSINFGPDRENISVNELINIIQKSYPHFHLNIKHSSHTIKEKKNLSLSNRLAKAHLNWKPKWDAKTSIIKTFEWYLSKNKKMTTYDQIKLFLS